MTNTSKTNTLSQASGFRVLGRIALSWGLLLVMVLAPFCWGLLPIGYNVLNKNDTIEANPFFTVFMRMATSFVLMALGAVGIWLWFGLFGKGEHQKSFYDLCRKTIGNAKSHRICLVLMSLFYFGARAIEMKYIMTYSFDRHENPEVKMEFKQNVSDFQEKNIYLQVHSGADNVPVPAVATDSDMKNIMDRTANALIEYGYFMGLMLALLWTVKNNVLYGMLSMFFGWLPGVLGIPKNGGTDNLNKLKGGKMTMVEWLFWFSTLFLTIASGIIYIVAMEPLYVWPYIAKMTGLACLVALCTSFELDCKILGKVEVDEDYKDCPGWLPALVASITLNLFQVGGTTLLALAWWWIKERTAGTDFVHLASLYFKNNNYKYLIFVIGLLASVVAPISQLLGVNLHKDKLKRIGMTRYGVTDDDWLIICEGFEPLFVMLVGCGVIWMDCSWLPVTQEPLINGWLMFIAVATVLVIALLRIAQVWSEKNSVIRNAIFAKVRGSTQDAHKDETADQLRIRAMKLSLLKFYDKRRELSEYAVSLTAPRLIDELELPSLGKLPGAHLTFIVNGQHFFTQDDPFTNDVLRSHELYLERKFPDVELVSLKRYLVNRGRVSGDEWRTVVRRDVREWAAKECEIAGDYMMPYVLVSNDEAQVNACIKEWSDLLGKISAVVKSGELDEYVNGMIVQMEGE